MSVLVCRNRDLDASRPHVGSVHYHIVKRGGESQKQEGNPKARPAQSAERGEERGGGSNATSGAGACSEQPSTFGWRPARLPACPFSRPFCPGRAVHCGPLISVNVSSGPLCHLHLRCLHRSKPGESSTTRGSSIAARRLPSCPARLQAAGPQANRRATSPEARDPTTSEPWGQPGPTSAMTAPTGRIRATFDETMGANVGTSRPFCFLLPRARRFTVSKTDTIKGCV